MWWVSRLEKRGGRGMAPLGMVKSNKTNPATRDRKLGIPVGLKGGCVEWHQSESKWILVGFG